MKALNKEITLKPLYLFVLKHSMILSVALIVALVSWFITVPILDDLMDRKTAETKTTKLVISEGRIQGDKIIYDIQAGEHKCQLIMTEIKNNPPHRVVPKWDCEKRKQQ